MAVKQTNDQYSAHVIEYCQCGQKELERDRNPLPQERQKTQDQDDIRRCGNRPARPQDLIRSDRGEINRRRHHHAGKGGDGGDCDLLPR